MFKLKNLVLFGGLLLFGWVGKNTYSYFFDKTVPVVTLKGIEAEDFCSGDVQCSVATNKSGNISVWLDGQPLISDYKISGGDKEQPFVIPSKTMENGKHSLKIDFVDRTFAKNKIDLERSFVVDNVPLQAAFVKADSDYKVFQGRTLHVQFQVNKEIKEAAVHSNSGVYQCFPEAKGSLVYETFIPISCEENPNEYLMTVEIKDRVGNGLKLDNKYQVVLFPFVKQTLTIADEKLQEAREAAGDAHKNFEEVLQKLAEQSPKEKLWRGTFCTPIDVARVTCEFGTIRTTQHRGRYAHKALDVINKPKSVVWAPQDGVVAFIGQFEAGGNTVVLDHGWGILSMFYHLDGFANIEVGQKVAKGNPLGKIGKTGHATGYHLHWEMRVNNLPVDPMQWTQATF